MALLKFSSKIADELLYEGKPVDRPVDWPPKKKSLGMLLKERDGVL